MDKLTWEDILPYENVLHDWVCSCGTCANAIWQNKIIEKCIEKLRQAEAEGKVCIIDNDPLMTDRHYNKAREMLHPDAGGQVNEQNAVNVVARLLAISDKIGKGGVR